MIEDVRRSTSHVTIGTKKKKIVLEEELLQLFFKLSDYVNVSQFDGFFAFHINLV